MPAHLPALPQEDWDAVSSAALQLFAFGQVEAAKRGLLLVDTKYEFGKDAAGGRGIGVA
jgi:phosphoribosylaminoimidazole-succinocarboxamide synthase